MSELLWRNAFEPVFEKEDANATYLTGDET